VLDLSQVLAGPAAAQLLADQGADVIKVENTKTGDNARGGDTVGISSSLFVAINRNKRSISVDLKQPEGLALLLRLVATADVFLQNFRPGVADRLGIGYDAVRK
jgi:formyl-CoA transferase